MRRTVLCRDPAVGPIPPVTRLSRSSPVHLTEPARGMNAPRASLERRDTGDPSGGAGRFACPTCGDSFKRLEHMYRHCQSHTDSRPFVCPTCGRRFARRYFRLWHGAVAYNDE